MWIQNINHLPEIRNKCEGIPCCLWLPSHLSLHSVLYYTFMEMNIALSTQDHKLSFCTQDHIWLHLYLGISGSSALASSSPTPRPRQRACAHPTGGPSFHSFCQFEKEEGKEQRRIRGKKHGGLVSPLLSLHSGISFILALSSDLLNGWVSKQMGVTWWPVHAGALVLLLLLLMQSWSQSQPHNQQNSTYVVSANQPGWRLQHILNSCRSRKQGTKKVTAIFCIHNHNHIIDQPFHLQIDVGSTRKLTPIGCIFAWALEHIELCSIFCLPRQFCQTQNTLCRLVCSCPSCKREKLKNTKEGSSGLCIITRDGFISLASMR